LLSFSGFVDVAAADDGENESDEKEGKTGSFEANNGRKTGVIVPSVAILAGSAPGSVNIAGYAASSASQITVVGLRIVSPSIAIQIAIAIARHC
jgi:hypothetical protein